MSLFRRTGRNMHLVTKHVFSKRSSVVRCVIGCMNGSTLSLAIAREPGRIGWVTGRTYTMGATPVYGWQASHDALGRPVSTADSESAARSWTYNARSEMTGCTGEDLSGTEQGAGNAPVAKRSGRLSEANPKGRKGPRVGGLLAVSCEGRFYVPIYGGNGNIMGYVDESGAFAAKFVYDQYGDVVSLERAQPAPMPSPDGSPVPIPVGLRGEDFSFGFSTKYHDREVGLVAYQLRSYSPALGRWLNRDPIEEDGGVNLYGFCLNNVFLYYDSKGESFEDFSNFCAREGDLYVYWPHPENGTSKESRTSLEEKSHRRPPKGSVLAHERGHAEVFVTLTKPRFENYISSYLSKKALTSEEKDEVKALFAKAQHDTIGESGKRANVNTVLWFHANGFSVTRRKSGGSLRPNAEDPYEFIKR